MIEGNYVLEATLPSCPYTLRNKLNVYITILFSFRRVFVFNSCSNCFEKGYKEKLLETSSNKRMVVTSVQGKDERYTLDVRVVKLQSLDAVVEGTSICRESNTESPVVQPVC